MNSNINKLILINFVNISNFGLPVLLMSRESGEYEISEKKRLENN